MTAVLTLAMVTTVAASRIMAWQTMKLRDILLHMSQLLPLIRQELLDGPISHNPHVKCALLTIKNIINLPLFSLFLVFVSSTGPCKTASPWAVMNEQSHTQSVTQWRWRLPENYVSWCSTDMCIPAYRALLSVAKPAIHVHMDFKANFKRLYALVYQPLMAPMAELAELVRKEATSYVPQEEGDKGFSSSRDQLVLTLKKTGGMRPILHLQTLGFPINWQRSSLFLPSH